MAKYTKEQIREALPDILAHPDLEVGSMEEFKQHTEVKRRMAKKKNWGAVLRDFATIPAAGGDAIVTEVPGFYVGHQTFESYNEETEEYELDREGPLILFADGEVRTQRGNRRSVYAIVRDPEEAQNLESEAEPMETEVLVTNVKVKHDLVLGQTTYTVTDDSEVVIKEHDSPIPQTGIEQHEQRCMNTNDRGVIYGQTRNPVFATLEIGEGEDIQFYPPGDFSDEHILKVTAYDQDDNPVNIKFKEKGNDGLQQAIDTFGLGHDPTVDDFRDRLEFEPIAVNGSFGITHPQRVAGIEDEDLRDAVRADIHNKVENGWFTKGDESPAGHLWQVDLSDHEEDYLVLGNEAHNIRVWDVFEEYDDLSGEKYWSLTLLCYDQESPPWMNCFPSPEKNGYIPNEGAFVKFTHHLGEGVTLSEDDPFAQIASEMPELNEEDTTEVEVEDETTVEEEVAVEEETIETTDAM